jgi:ADP-heptose:LPS heptosyltransferase
MTDRPTILVLRALGLGDIITGLPALAMVRRARPDHRIVLAAPTYLRPLVQLSGSVDEMVQAHELEPIVDPPSGVELAIDLHGNGPASMRLLQACAPRRLLAFAAPGPPRWSVGEHEVLRWCRLVSEGLGIRAPAVPTVAGSLAVPYDVPAPAGATVVHCGAKSQARRWPPERFAEVAARLRADQHDVVVTGGAAEAELAAGIAEESGACARSDLSLAELLSLVARARLVVSGDTGVSHVASAYRTPSVTLFGPVSPAGWGPPPHARHQVLWHGDGRGDPHGSTVDAALTRITVAEVMAAAARATESPVPSERVLACLRPTKG